MNRANLKTAEPSMTFKDVLQQIVTLMKEQRIASRIQCRRLNAAAYMKEALRLAGTTQPEIEALDAHLASLSPSAETDPALRFVHGLTRLAADPNGTWSPPAGNFPYASCGTTADEVTSGCMDLHVSRLELAAVSALRATRAHPEIFKEGCDDAQAHEQYLAELVQQIEKLMQQAADLLSLDDLLFTFGDTGSAHVAYALSGGIVPASGPGDPRGIPGLISWMEENAA